MSGLGHSLSLHFCSSLRSLLISKSFVFASANSSLTCDSNTEGLLDSLSGLGLGEERILFAGVEVLGDVGLGSVFLDAVVVGGRKVVLSLAIGVGRSRGVGIPVLLVAETPPVVKQENTLFIYDRYLY